MDRKTFRVLAVETERRINSNSVVEAQCVQTERIVKISIKTDWLTDWGYIRILLLAAHTELEKETDPPITQGIIL